jgi:hypothetical protein
MKPGPSVIAFELNFPHNYDIRECPETARQWANQHSGLLFSDPEHETGTRWRLG